MVKFNTNRTSKNILSGIQNCKVVSKLLPHRELDIFVPIIHNTILKCLHGLFVKGTLYTIIIINDMIVKKFDT